MLWKISKEEFYSRGGFANPNLCRRMKGSAWHYYRISN